MERRFKWRKLLGKFDFMNPCIMFSFTLDDNYSYTNALWTDCNVIVRNTRIDKRTMRMENEIEYANVTDCGADIAPNLSKSQMGGTRGHLLACLIRFLLSFIPCLLSARLVQKTLITNRLFHLWWLEATRSWILKDYGCRKYVWLVRLDSDFWIKHYPGLAKAKRTASRLTSCYGTLPDVFTF